LWRAEAQKVAKLSFAADVPKQSLGTRVVQAVCNTARRHGIYQ